MLMAAARARLIPEQNQSLAAYHSDMRCENDSIERRALVQISRTDSGTSAMLSRLIEFNALTHSEEN